VPGGDVLGDMGGAERFVAGLAMNARNAGYGLLESAVSGGPNAAIARKLRDAALPQQQSVRGLIAGGEDNRDMLQRAEQWLIDRQQANAPEDDALNDTWGGKAGNFTGYAAQLLLPAGLAKAAGNVPQLARAKSGLEALYAAAMPTTFQGAAMQGSLLGAAQPVAEGDSRVANAGVGAVAGPLGMLLGRGIGKFTQAVVSPFRQISNQAIEQRAADVLRSEADDVTRLMVPQPSAVPGVRRTLAEESLDPGIARLERNARGTGGGFDALDRANNAARVSSLRAFAQDDAAITAAQQARHVASNGLRQRAMRAPPADTARLVSQIARLEAGQQGRPSVQSGLAQVRKLLEAPEGMERLPMPVLYNVRKTLDEMLSGKYGGDSSAALAGSRELMAVKGQLDRVMAKSSPEFAQYLDAYRKGSEPINRMQVGQQLISQKSGSAVLDPLTGEQVLLPAAFSSQARNLDRVAQQATGFRKATANSVLRPEDRAAIAAVQDDLERRAFAATAGDAANSHTRGRLALDQRVAGQVTGRAIPFFKEVSEELHRVGHQRLEAKLASVLANPAEARRVLSSLPPGDRRIIETAMARAGVVAGDVSSRYVPTE
jgi:hypothetical protein